MKWIKLLFFRNPLSDLKYLAGTDKDLKDLSMDELYEFIDNNEKVDPRILAIMCSEYIRRIARHGGKYDM